VEEKSEKERKRPNDPKEESKTFLMKEKN